MPLILTVANLRPPKGLEVLARIAERLQGANAPWVWVIAGEGPLATSLAAELAERELATRVRLLGFRRDVPALLAASDIFCLTSNREGCRSRSSRRWRRGKPVVATDVGGVRELVVASGTPEVVRRGRNRGFWLPREMIVFPRRRARRAHRRSARRAAM